MSKKTKKKKWNNTTVENNLPVLLKNVTLFASGDWKKNNILKILLLLFPNTEP